MITLTLTDGESSDAANIVRNYADRIRLDIEDAKKRGDTPAAIIEALEQAAVSRDKLADKLEGVS